MAELLFNLLTTGAAILVIVFLVRALFRAAVRSRMVPRANTGHEETDPVEQSVQITFRY